MGKSRLTRRLFASYLTVACAGVVLSGLLVDRTVRESSFAQVQIRLQGEATMLGQMTASALFGELDDSDTSLNESVRALGRAAQTELSVLSPSGAVVADSNSDPKTLAPEGEAPEIVTARRDGLGTAIRGSNGGRLYVANAIVRDGKLLGFARSAMPMPAVRAEALSVRTRMVSGAALAIAIAFVLAIVMTFRIVRPVRELAAGAREIGAGRYGHQVAASSDDEVGELARAFNEMSRGLRGTIDELDGRNRDMRIVLDNVREGLITVAADGTMSREKSAAVERWLGPSALDTRLWNYLFPNDPLSAQMLELHWQQLVEDVVPIELCLDQLPKRIHTRDRTFDVEYTPIFDDGKLDKLLVVLADVTEHVEALRVEAAQREVLAVFERIVRDRTGFADFLAETHKLVARITGNARPEAEELKRALHTLKGNAAVYGLASIADVCHDLESRLEDGRDLEATDRELLLVPWRRFTERMSVLVGERDLAHIEIHDRELESLANAVVDGASRPEILRTLAEWRAQRVDLQLERFAEQARSIVRKLGKGEVRIKVDCSDRLRVDREAMAPFWSVFVHVIRNAADHGSAPASERGGSAGTIQLRGFRADDLLSIEVSDDGPGVDWTAIRSRAASLGLPHQTKEDLVRALFAGGLSTRETVTATSGRGVGLSAVWRVCEELRGRIRIDGQRGQGTTIRFDFPASAVGPKRIALAAPCTIPPSASCA
jgi:two-component system, chemotaxis family, sensor kinase CheA